MNTSLEGIHDKKMSRFKDPLVALGGLCCLVQVLILGRGSVRSPQRSAPLPMWLWGGTGDSFWRLSRKPPGEQDAGSRSCCQKLL